MTDLALEHSAQRLLLALLEFMDELRQSRASGPGVHPEPMQCGACAPTEPLQAVGRMLPAQPEYAPILPQHLPIRCSAGTEGQLL